MKIQRLLQNLILLFIALAVAITLARGQTVTLQKPGYTVTYDRQYGPVRVDWVLTKANLTAFDRSGVPFAPDLTLPRGWYVAHTSDYAGTGYDRGHLCPSADKQAATFVMSNVAPQAPKLNRQSWEHLEARCRYWAAHGYTVTITAGVCDSIGTIAHGHITVPGHFWKVVKLMGGKTDRTLYTLFPNTNQAGTVSWPTFTVSPERFRAKTGISL